MKIRNILKKIIKNEAKNETIFDENSINDTILKTLIAGEEIDREKVLMIPAVSSAVGLICDSFARIPFILDKRNTKDGKIETT